MNARKASATGLSIYCLHVIFLSMVTPRYFIPFSYIRLSETLSLLGEKK
jgi:hypothetical protein